MFARFICFLFALSVSFICSAQQFGGPDPKRVNLPSAVKEKLRTFPSPLNQFVEYKQRAVKVNGVLVDAIEISNPISKELLDNKADSLHGETVRIFVNAKQHFFPKGNKDTAVVKVWYYDRLRYPLCRSLAVTFYIKGDTVGEEAKWNGYEVPLPFVSYEVNKRLDSFKLKKNQYIQFDSTDRSIGLMTIKDTEGMTNFDSLLDDAQVDALRLLFEILQRDYYKFKQVVIGYTDKTGVSGNAGIILDLKESDVEHRYEELKGKYLKNLQATTTKNAVH